MVFNALNACAIQAELDRTSSVKYSVQEIEIEILNPDPHSNLKET
jgi:hypothetical protein